MTLFGWLHIGAAGFALVVGLMIVSTDKGTPRHRLRGRIYLAAMILVNLASLMIYRDSPEMGVFHYLAFLSLATLACGYGILKLGRRSLIATVQHGYFMSWSYAGLAGAGIGQAGAALGLNVLACVMVSLALFGLVIHTRKMPSPPIT